MADVRIGPLVAPRGQFILLGCLLASYIFSFIYYEFLLPRKTPKVVKHLYIIAIAELFIVLNFGWIGMLNLHLPILFTHTFARLFRRRPWMPLVNFAIILGHLSCAHLYRQFWEAEGAASIDRYTVDFTGPLMMLTIKLTSFAFDISDAYYFNSQSHPKTASPSPKPVVSSGISISGVSISSISSNPIGLPLSERQSKLPLVDSANKFAKLRIFPSLLEFLGYSLLFPGLLTGPTITFYEYRTFIDGSYFEGVDLAKNALPGRKRRALRQFLTGIFFLAIYNSLRDRVPLPFVLSAEYISWPLWRRLLYIHLSAFVQRIKYYIAWTIAEGSYVIIGLGYRTSPSRKPLWDRLENVAPAMLETTPDFRRLVAGWNVCTNQWLHAYVYRRLTKHYYGKSGSGSRASLATYVVSAFWHGFYPGYYLAFSTAAWITIFSRLVHKTIAWPFGSRLQRLLLLLPVYILIDYMAVPFILLDWKRSIAYWRSFWFFGHIFLALGTGLLLWLNGGNRMRRLSERSLWLFQNFRIRGSSSAAGRNGPGVTIKVEEATETPSQRPISKRQVARTNQVEASDK